MKEEKGNGRDTGREERERTVKEEGHQKLRIKQNGA